MFSSRLASQTFRASRNIARPSSKNALLGTLRSHQLPGAISHAQRGSSGSQRAFSNTRMVLTNNSNAPASSPPSLQPQSTETEPAVKQSDEPRLSLTFTCTVPDCGERSTHQFTKRAYERGIVLIECPKCKNRHLIADHIGWFKETDGTDGGKLRTIEDLMRAKGEEVKRGKLHAGGVVEYVE